MMPLPSLVEIAPDNERGRFPTDACSLNDPKGLGGPEDLVSRRYFWVT